MGRVAAIILGGGQGTRLFPLTAERSKPAVPLFGRYRLVDIPLSNCLHSNMNKIFVLTQFNSASLHRHIRETYKFDSFSRGFVEILAAEQTPATGDWFQGTADAVRKHLINIQNVKPDHYLILSGDHLYRMDYRPFLEAHIANDADVTVATLPVSKRDTSGFGIMKVQKDGRIKSFVEKPSTEEALKNMKTPRAFLEECGYEVGKRDYLASMGVYLFKAEVLEKILETRTEWIDFGKHIIPGTLKDHNSCAYLFDGFWEDIGTVRSYYQVHMDMLCPDPPVDFRDPQHIMYTHPRYLPGAYIENAKVDRSIICEGSQVLEGAQIEHSIVGIRSIVRKNAVIKDSIIMGVDFFVDKNDPRYRRIGIGENSRITRAIIDKSACIGKDVVIKGSPDLKDEDGKGYAIRDGIVIVLKNARIAKGTRIGKV